jgi:hypothetical protein
LLSLSTLNALRGALLRPKEFLPLFPSMTTPIFYAYLACAVLILVSMAGIWFWRRWSVHLMIPLTAVVFALDLTARAPVVHLVAGPASLALLLYFMWPVWARFQ